MTKKEPIKEKEFELLSIALNEAKDNHKFHLDKFDDVKKKSQIFLLISSLLITLPLSNDFIIKNLLLYDKLLTLFIVGILLLVLSILLLVIILSGTQVHMPNFEHFKANIGKFTYQGNMISLIDAYARDIKGTKKKFKYKESLLRYVEAFIISGVIFISLSLIILILQVS